MACIRVLREDDDRSSFSCGQDDLDRFFRKFAGRNQFLLHIGVTYGVEDRGRILAYATVAPGAIRADQYPAARAKRLPRYPLPVLRLARLAVERTQQRKGHGTMLLKYVFLRALAMAEGFGCAGVLVDAKPEAVEYYARFGFEPADAIEGRIPSRPEPVPMFLDIGTIRAACGM